jgi:hypothetical protein
MSAKDSDTMPDNAAHDGYPAVPCSRLDYERAIVCRLAEEWGEFVTDVDGFVYWWPSAKPEHAGHFSPYQLRILADELDRRNAPWQAVIDAEFSSENSKAQE